jgi:hypothetical protein
MLNTDTPSAGDRELGPEYVYVFENDTIKQSVTLNYLTDIEISFRYTVENKTRQQNAFIQGTAKNEYSEYDPEMDEDEEGVAYFADEFIYSSNGFRLAFRIAEDQTLLRNCFDLTFTLFY